ncbi:tRNA pseudouridine32 synthase / 23S rRNA pseudouridine746 synthase [Desulfobotulus alkaliphilus]|uniref:tRNA pseudouridine32 synthase / 23S rRNA pseudouridine746 synthase n=1 Tax=Desulfobotulus alkaliphilus TaxID=622671 RepID=A0A562RZE3_9BACT|nr:RNA pseudouridine synthase [Desulfobotulus alkaliphilus]TWI74308.1 tRNA pseudouridine32 synthase / 23S rRNA pseudouridine746 synthase [Desulfobotulus alkaliphilus]
MVPILFENEELLALEKPEGIAVIPERHKESACLLHIMEEKLGKRLFVVHRLDKEVSGILLFAKTAQMHRHLNLEFEQRRIQKTYMALVHGCPKEKTGNIHASIRAFGSGRMGIDPEKGKGSHTRWEVIRGGKDQSLLAAFPVTGRRHQIRVHLYHIGHPIVGDLRYGDKNMQKNYPRLMLHAHGLECRMPDGKMLRLDSPLPDVFSVW